MVNFLRRGWVWTLKDSCFLENRVLRLESCCSTNTVTDGDSLMVCPLDTTVGPPCVPARFRQPRSLRVLDRFYRKFSGPGLATDWVCCTQSIAGRYLTIRRCTVVENSRERTRINSVFFKRNQNRNCVGDDQWSSAFHALDLALDTTWKRTPLIATWGKRLHWKRTSPRYNNRTPPGCPRNISRAKMTFWFFMMILIFGGRFLESHLWTILNIGQHR